MEDIVKLLSTSADELQRRLPNVGAARAKKLFDFIEQKKPYFTLEDLARVSDLSVQTWRAFSDEGRILMPVQQLWDSYKEFEDVRAELEGSIQSLRESLDEAYEKRDLAESSENEIKEHFRRKLEELVADNEITLGKKDEEMTDLHLKLTEHYEARLRSEEDLAKAKKVFEAECKTLEGQVMQLRGCLEERDVPSPREDESLLTRIRELESTVQQMSDDRETDELSSSAKIGGLQTQIDTLETHIRELEEERSQMQHEIAGLRSKHSALLLEKGTLEGDLHAARRMQTDLRQETEMLVRRHQAELQNVQEEADARLNAALNRCSELEERLKHTSGQATSPSGVSREVENMFEEILSSIKQKPSALPRQDRPPPSPAAAKAWEDILPERLRQNGGHLPCSATPKPQSPQEASYSLHAQVSPDFAKYQAGVERVSRDYTPPPPPDYRNVHGDFLLHHRPDDAASGRLHRASYDGASGGIDLGPHRRPCDVAGDSMYAGVRTEGYPPSFRLGGDSHAYRSGSIGNQDLPGSDRHHHDSGFDRRGAATSGGRDLPGSDRRHHDFGFDRQGTASSGGRDLPGSDRRYPDLGFDGQRAMPSGGQDLPGSYHWMNGVRDLPGSHHSRFQGGPSSLQDIHQDKKHSHHDRRRSSSSDSRFSLDLDSDSSDAAVELKPTKSQYKRPSGPPPPKMATFSGTAGTWKSFFLQFKQSTKQYHWDDTTKRKRLLECLRGRAIEYIYAQESSVRKDYRRLVKALDRRFGDREEPSMMRRHLQTALQGEEEELDDWADRVFQLVRDSYPHGNEDVLQEMAIESFFRGCREKRAVATAADKLPKTLSAALKLVKTTIGNQRAFLGSRAYSTRQVGFDLDNVERKPRPAMRSGTNSGEEDSLKKLLVKMEEIENRLKHCDLRQRSTPRSPSSSPVKCFSCGAGGHFSKDCPKKSTTSPSASPQRPTVCFSCQKPGHMAKDCPSKVRQRSQSPSNRSSSRDSVSSN